VESTEAGKARPTTTTSLPEFITFDAFVQTEGPRLKGLARLVAGDDWLAEDLLQGVLAKCMPRWERIAQGDPIAYVRRSLVNARISYWRQHRRQVIGDVPEGSTSSHEHAVVDRITIDMCIKQLSRQQRQIIALRYSYDLTEVDIAGTLSVNVGTVKSQHSRAMKKLRLLLQDAGDTGGAQAHDT